MSNFDCEKELGLLHISDIDCCDFKVGQILQVHTHNRPTDGRVKTRVMIKSHNCAYYKAVSVVDERWKLDALDLILWWKRFTLLKTDEIAVRMDTAPGQNVHATSTKRGNFSSTNLYQKILKMNDIQMVNTKTK